MDPLGVSGLGTDELATARDRQLAAAVGVQRKQLRLEAPVPKGS